MKPTFRTTGTSLCQTIIHTAQTTSNKNQPSSGCTALLVNRHLIHHYSTIITNSIINTIVHIHLNNAKLKLIAVYISPKTVIQITDLDAFIDTPANTIRAGDLNAK